MLGTILLVILILLLLGALPTSKTMQSLIGMRGWLNLKLSGRQP